MTNTPSCDITWKTNFGRLCKVVSNKEERKTVHNFVFEKSDKDTKEDESGLSSLTSLKSCELICSEVRFNDCGCKDKISCSCRLVYKFDDFHLISGLDEIVHANLENFNHVVIISVTVSKKKIRQ